MEQKTETYVMKQIKAKMKKYRSLALDDKYLKGSRASLYDSIELINYLIDQFRSYRHLGSRSVNEAAIEFTNFVSIMRNNILHKLEGNPFSTMLPKNGKAATQLLKDLFE